nr:RecName: Full=Short neurotoxin N2; AltName: Full=Alpha-neurotoxin [Pseudonaja textilis]
LTCYKGYHDTVVCKP